MSIHKNYEKLTETERAAVDEVFHDAYAILASHGVPLAGDDRAERAVEAMATAVIESRPEPETFPAEPDHGPRFEVELCDPTASDSHHAYMRVIVRAPDAAAAKLIARGKHGAKLTATQARPLDPESEAARVMDWIDPDTCPDCRVSTINKHGACNNPACGYGKDGHHAARHR